MSFMGRFRILTKVLSIVALLSAVAVTIAWLAVAALGDLSEKADLMASAAKRALLAARTNQNVIALNRAEFRSALDPSDENRLAAREIIQAQLKQYEERFAQVSETRDEKAKAMLPDVRNAFAAYKAQLEKTLAVVDAEKSANISASTVRLREAAMTSRTAAEELQAKVRAVADRLNSRVEEKAKEAHDQYESTSRFLIILAGFGIVVGAVLGFLVGQFGVAKPIRAIVALLQQLAGGNYDVVVHSTDRKDGVGDGARTGGFLKERGPPRPRMEPEKRETE